MTNDGFWALVSHICTRLRTVDTNDEIALNTYRLSAHGSWWWCVQRI